MEFYSFIKGRTMRSGYGLFFAESGNKKSRDCNVCGSKMDVENYHGPTSWGGAMAGEKRACKRLVCPHIKKDWHEQAVDIMMEEERTKSPTLKRLLSQDVANIVRDGLNIKENEGYG